MGKPKRTVTERDSGRHDSRYVATATLSTGKVLRVVGEFQPSHWSLTDRRAEVLNEAKRQLALLEQKYGLTVVGEVRLDLEHRTTRRFTEETITSKLDSLHTVGGA